VIEDFWDVAINTEKSNAPGQETKLDTTAINHISHSGLVSACLQTQVNADRTGWEKAILAQVVDGIDPECFYELQFWGARLDEFNGTKVNPTSTIPWSLNTRALVFWGDVTPSILDGTLNESDADIRIRIFEGSPNQVLVNTDVPPLINDYDFESYRELLICDCTTTCGCADAIPPGTTQATIVFIAEEVNADPIPPVTVIPDDVVGSTWYIDDVIFS
jgi:hypothetical protein